MSFEDFDTFKSQTVLEGKIRLDSALNIGGAELDDKADNPVIKIKINGVDTPYIPGSSLKGVMRSEIERVFRSIGEEVCEIPNVHDGKDGNDYCAVCGIFGGMGLSAHVRVNDAFPLKENVTISLKPGVAINRTLGTAQSGALYNMEIVHPSQLFNFKMIIDNIPIVDAQDGDKRSQALHFILQKMLSGNFAIGKKTSSGLGDITLEDLKLTETTPDPETFTRSTSYSVSLEGGKLQFKEV